MKPNPRQIAVIKALARDIEWWQHSNDIESPTLQYDLKSELFQIPADDGCDNGKLLAVWNAATGLLNQIREIK